MKIEPKRVAPAKLAHIVLLTHNLRPMRAWYMNVLSAKPAYENDQVSFLTYDEEHHRVGILSHDGPIDKHSPLAHIAFTYNDLPTLLSNYLRLKSKGILPFWTVNHGPTISMYYRDPDGNQLELQHDVFATSEEVDHYFSSGAHDRNFIGVIFDPEEMIDRLEKGVPISELTARPELEPGVSPWDMVRH